MELAKQDTRLTMRRFSSHGMSTADLTLELCSAVEHMPIVDSVSCGDLHTLVVLSDRKVRRKDWPIA